MAIVSILIPTYNEEAHVEECLRSVRAFTVPDGTAVEILVIDGMSTDRTREIVSRLASQDSAIQLLDNPERYQSPALNRGIHAARGDYILRLDAHSYYPPEYLQRCLETALRTKADNTGGIVRTMSRGEGYPAKLVQALITHRFGVGNSGFRTDAPEGPADTVPYGFFRRDVFERVGLFDERLIRAQDYEMNRRIVANGGTVWRNPQIHLDYFPQPDFRSFIRKQFVYEAPYNAYMWYLAPYSFALRHAITAAFATGVIAGLVLSPFSSMVRTVFTTVMLLYGLLAIASAISQGIRYRDARHVLFLPVAFFLYHFLHGLGVIVGLVRLATHTAPVQTRTA
ncbi:MAG TPA: glycosyltransferase family 2 protein [Gemmatimonadaceae bacterium]|nr:glycosyltransferase family 2 protein [Gemmatimonadaceae bacterium]